MGVSSAAVKDSPVRESYPLICCCWLSDKVFITSWEDGLSGPIQRKCARRKVPHNDSVTLRSDRGSHLVVTTKTHFSPGLWMSLDSSLLLTPELEDKESQCVVINWNKEIIVLLEEKTRTDQLVCSSGTKINISVRMLRRKRRQPLVSSC